MDNNVISYLAIAFATAAIAISFYHQMHVKSWRKRFAGVLDFHIGVAKRVNDLFLQRVRNNRWECVDMPVPNLDDWPSSTVAPFDEPQGHYWLRVPLDKRTGADLVRFGYDLRSWEVNAGMAPATVQEFTIPVLPGLEKLIPNFLYDATRLKVTYRWEYQDESQGGPAYKIWFWGKDSAAVAFELGGMLWAAKARKERDALKEFYVFLQTTEERPFEDRAVEKGFAVTRKGNGMFVVSTDTPADLERPFALGWYLRGLREGLEPSPVRSEEMPC